MKAMTLKEFRTIWAYHLGALMLERVMLALEEREVLRKMLDEDAGQVYSHAIHMTPSGKLRNKLTELNMLRMKLLKETVE